MMNGLARGQGPNAGFVVLVKLRTENLVGPEQNGDMLGVGRDIKSTLNNELEYDVAKPKKWRQMLRVESRRKTPQMRLIEWRGPQELRYGKNGGMMRKILEVRIGGRGN